MFGRVIGNGITVADKISSLKTYTVGGITDFPLKDYVQSLVSSMLNIHWSNFSHKIFHIFFAYVKRSFVQHCS